MKATDILLIVAAVGVLGVVVWKVKPAIAANTKNPLGLPAYATTGDDVYGNGGSIYGNAGNFGF